MKMRAEPWSAAAKPPLSGSSPYIEFSESAQARRVATVSDFLTVGLFWSRSQSGSFAAAVPSGSAAEARDDSAEYSVSATHRL